MLAVSPALLKTHVHVHAHMPTFFMFQREMKYVYPQIPGQNSDEHMNMS